MKGLLKLLQEIQIIIKKQAQIVDAVAQHGKAVEADAEGEAGVAFGVDVHILQDIGVYHAAAADFQPFAVVAHDVDFGGRLGKREE